MTVCMWAYCCPFMPPVLYVYMFIDVPSICGYIYAYMQFQLLSTELFREKLVLIACRITAD